MGPPGLSRAAVDPSPLDRVVHAVDLDPGHPSPAKLQLEVHGETTGLGGDAPGLLHLPPLGLRLDDQPVVLPPRLDLPLAVPGLVLVPVGLEGTSVTIRRLLPVRSTSRGTPATTARTLHPGAILRSQDVPRGLERLEPALLLLVEESGEGLLRLLAQGAGPLLQGQRPSYRSRTRQALASKSGSRGKIQLRWVQGRMASSVSHRHKVGLPYGGDNPAAEDFALELREAPSRQRSRALEWQLTREGLNRDDDAGGKSLPVGLSWVAPRVPPSVSQRSAYATC